MFGALLQNWANGGRDWFVCSSHWLVECLICILPKDTPKQVWRSPGKLFCLWDYVTVWGGETVYREKNLLLQPFLWPWSLTQSSRNQYISKCQEHLTQVPKSLGFPEWRQHPSFQWGHSRWALGWMSITRKPRCVKFGVLCWMWCHKPINPTLGRARLEDQQFDANLRC